MKKPNFEQEENYLYLGRFDFGRDVVGLLAEVGEASSGHVFMSYADPEKNLKAHHSKVEGLNYLIVGLNHPSWGRCLATFLHEAMEFAMMQKQVRYENAESYSRSHGGYVFMFDHEQYSDMMERVGVFTARAQVPMNQAWRARKHFKPISLSSDI